MNQTGARRGGEQGAGREEGGEERSGLVEWEAKAAKIPCNLQRKAQRKEEERSLGLPSPPD